MFEIKSRTYKTCTEWITWFPSVSSLSRNIKLTDIQEVRMSSCEWRGRCEWERLVTIDTEGFSDPSILWVTGEQLVIVIGGPYPSHTSYDCWEHKQTDPQIPTSDQHWFYFDELFHVSVGPFGIWRKVRLLKFWVACEVCLFNRYITALFRSLYLVVEHVWNFSHQDYIPYLYPPSIYSLWNNSISQSFLCHWLDYNGLWKWHFPYYS